MEANSSTTKAKTARVQSLQRGLNILEFIAESRQFVRLKDVAEHFSLDSATAYRFLKTLEELGYLQRHSVLKAYSLGSRSKLLAEQYADTSELVDLLRPVLKTLTQQTKQIAHLGVLEGNSAILAEVVLTDEAAVAVHQAVGDLEFIYCSAVGKAILSFLPAMEQKALLNTIEFEERTLNTIVSKVALDRQLKDIKITGLAFDDREGNEDVCCIAAPILTKSGYPIASIGISMVATIVGTAPSEQVDCCRAVQQAARRCEKLLTKKPSI